MILQNIKKQIENPDTILNISVEEYVNDCRNYGIVGNRFLNNLFLLESLKKSDPIEHVVIKFEIVFPKDYDYQQRRQQNAQNWSAIFPMYTMQEIDDLLKDRIIRNYCSYHQYDQEDAKKIFDKMHNLLWKPHTMRKVPLLQVLKTYSNGQHQDLQDLQDLSSTTIQILSANEQAAVIQKNSEPDQLLQTFHKISYPLSKPICPFILDIFFYIYCVLFECDMTIAVFTKDRKCHVKTITADQLWKREFRMFSGLIALIKRTVWNPKLQDFNIEHAQSFWQRQEEVNLYQLNTKDTTTEVIVDDFWVPYETSFAIQLFYRTQVDPLMLSVVLKHVKNSSKKRIHIFEISPGPGFFIHKLIQSLIRKKDLEKVVHITLVEKNEESAHHCMEDLQKSFSWDHIKKDNNHITFTRKDLKVQLYISDVLLFLQQQQKQVHKQQQLQQLQQQTQKQQKQQTQKQQTQKQQLHFRDVDLWISEGSALSENIMGSRQQIQILRKMIMFSTASCMLYHIGLEKFFLSKISDISDTTQLTQRIRPCKLFCSKLPLLFQYHDFFERVSFQQVFMGKKLVN